MLLALPLLAILFMLSLALVLGKPRFLVSNKAAPVRSNVKAKVSVIIPARNEENNLPRLLKSFQQSVSQPHEIIVVDDGSTDATARVAQKLGATIITPEPPSAGWKGKPWACKTGAKEASGDWLLFLDADTWLEPEGYETILALADKEEVSSICPYHRIETPVEEFSAFFNLIMVAGSNAFGLPASSRNNSALFGQSLLIPKQTYQHIGGHEKVKSEILENFHLAEHLHVPRHPSPVLFGKRGAHDAHVRRRTFRALEELEKRIHLRSQASPSSRLDSHLTVADRWHDSFRQHPGGFAHPASSPSFSQFRRRLLSLICPSVWLGLSIGGQFFTAQRALVSHQSGLLSKPLLHCADRQEAGHSN